METLSGNVEGGEGQPLFLEHSRELPTLLFQTEITEFS